MKQTKAPTESSTPHLTPDSLTGAILAIEGIRDAAVLLNWPTGCKFDHGAIAEGQLPRESSYAPLRFLDEFYFGHPRVPATYLDGDDNVFGASDKLERILPMVAANEHSLIAVVNSPGAARLNQRFLESRPPWSPNTPWTRCTAIAWAHRPNAQEPSWLARGFICAGM